MLSDPPTGDLFAGHRDLAEIREVVRRLKETSERRRAARRVYSVVQAIAPYDGVRLPRPGMFCPVRCCDISQSGIAFILPGRPTFEQVIVALGQAPDLLYLAARVARFWRPAALRGDWEIGCRFLRKVRLSG